MLDRYTKVVLTVIAVCLVALTWAQFVPVNAQGTFICKGELKANAWGGIKEIIGGYDVLVTCRD